MLDRIRSADHVTGQYAGRSIRTERPEEERSPSDPGKGFAREAIEHRSSVRTATPDVFPAEDGVNTAWGYAVDLSGLNTQTAFGKNEQNVTTIGNLHGF